MKENNYNPRIGSSYVSENSAVDVQLEAMIEEEVQKLAVQKVEPHLNRLEYAEAEDLPVFQEPKTKVENKNGLIDISLFDLLMVLIAVFFGVYAEILLAQTIFEKVLKIDPEKSFIMSLGITVILFTCAALIKRSVKRYLRSKSKIPVLFKIGVITSCVMLFIFGGLSYYNINKDEARKKIVLLNKQLTSIQNALEDDETNEEMLRQKEVLEKQIASKMEAYSITPFYVKGSSFLALSVMSLVMLFCSSFLKAYGMICIYIHVLKLKMRIARSKIYRLRRSYNALKIKAEKAHNLSIYYLRLVARKASIEGLLSLIPITSEYKQALGKRFHNVKHFGIIVFLFASSFQSLAQESNYTVILVDKSVSMKSSSKQDKYIKKIIRKACRNRSAEIEVRFINTNSASIVGRKVFRFRQKEFDPSLYSPDEVELQKEIFKSSINSAKRRFSKKVVEFINSYSAKARWTEILESIVPISRLKQKDIDIFFFTDGIESSQFRDMNRQGFRSEKEALAASRLDVTKLRKKYQLPKELSQINEIRFIFPIDMESNNNIFEFLQVYWQEVFKKFDFHNLKFETL